MKMLSVILTSLLTSFVCSADPIRIGIIDTGLVPLDYKFNLCPGLSKNFFSTGEIVDINNNIHGTNIAALIQENLVGEDYCLVIYRAIDKKEKCSLDVFYAAIKDKVDIINISAGGPEKSDFEEKAIKLALDSGIIVVAAAGNETADLDKKCNFYPACSDKRIIVVGNLYTNGKKIAETSNYSGTMNNFVVVRGTKQCAAGVCMTGTSQATANMTAQVAKILLLQRKKNNVNKKD